MYSIAERRIFILDTLNEKGFIKVSETAEKLGVTKATVRKDLKFLESKQMLFRAHGSAMPAPPKIHEEDVNLKAGINSEQKRRIASEAVKLIVPDDSIILAGGSTMMVFAEALDPAGHLNVVTSSLGAACKLAKNPSITVIALGGTVHGHSLAVRGEQTALELGSILCNKVFFGVDGFSPDYGFTCASVDEAMLTRQMIRSATEAVVLCDSSKFGKRGFGRICGMSEVSILITDGGLPAEARKAIEAAGVRVIIA